MDDDYSLGSRANTPGEKPIELQHWTALPWSEAKSLNEFYKLANDKQSHIMIIDAEINEDNLPTLATYISSSTTLTGICLSGNKLGDMGLKNLMNQIYEAGGRQIEVLAVNNNNLTQASAKVIGKLIGNDYCNIQRLSLSENPLKDSFAKAFIKFLKLNTSIFELDLASSQIEFSGVAALVRVFKFNTRMVQFHLHKQPEETDVNETQGISNIEMYSTRLFTQTKAGRKMKPKKKEAMERIFRLTDKCIKRNLRIRYAKSRCADILRKGTYAVKLQAARITLLGAEKSGKTGVAHALLGKVPIYYPNHNATIALATAVLQTFQPESKDFNEMLKNISPEVTLERKEKYYARRALMPFDVLTEKDDIEASKKKNKKGESLESIQLWRATRRSFDGLVALAAHREATIAAQQALAVDDETAEAAGKTLYTNPETINDRIVELAERYGINAFQLDRDIAILPKKHFDELSVGSWDLDNQGRTDLSATLAVAAKSHEQVMRLNFLFDDVDTEISFNTKVDTDTFAGTEPRTKRNESKVEGSQNVPSKYKNYKKANDERLMGTETPKISTTEEIQGESLVWNPLVSELSIRDIATDDILFRSYFGDTCLFNLFDLGGGALAQMLAKFAIVKDGINTLVFDMERSAKADLGMSDVIREELTMWYRCIELFAGKDATIVVVGTGKDTIDRLASNNIVTDKKTDYGRLNAGATSNTMKRKKGYSKDTKDVVRNIFLSLNKDIVLSVVHEDNKNLLVNEEDGLAFFPVSNLFIEGVEPIKAFMEGYARNLATQLDYQVPIRWLKLLELSFARYSEAPNVNYRLPTKSIVQLARNIGFSCKKEIELCLQKFDQLGFLQFNNHTHEIGSWVVMDSIPIYKSLLKFAQCYRVDLAISPMQAKLEELYPNEMVLLRNHGIMSKHLFKLLWQGGGKKEDLNFGVKWLTEHYFMTEILIDGDRYFFFPCFSREPEYFQKKAVLVDAPREKIFFAISFAPNRFLPPALVPRLVALLFGANIQENFISLEKPLKTGAALHPTFNIFTRANTSSRVFLTKGQIRIQFGGQIMTMTQEGNELIFGLSQEEFSNRIVVMVHAMLSKINNDVFLGSVLWDIIFFQNSQSKSYTQAMGSFGTAPVLPPRGNRPQAPPSVVHSTYGGETIMMSQASEGLVAYESDEDEETVVGVTGRRIRLSFNEARSKKLRPFFANEMDDNESCVALWHGARNSMEALHHFKVQEVPENLEDYCNHLKHRYLSNSF